MKRKTLFKILIGIVAVLLLAGLATMLFVEPWVDKKIRSALSDQESKYQIEVEKIDVSLFTLGMELTSITIQTKEEQADKGNLSGTIESIKCKGINLKKIIFNKDFAVREIKISNSTIAGKISLEKDTILIVQPILSTLNLEVHTIYFDEINLSLKDTATAKAYDLQAGTLKVFDFQILKADTISISTITKFDFDAKHFHTVTSDSLYSISADGIHYSDDSKTLSLDSFSVQPNYDEYAFTSRHQFQTSRIDVGCRQIIVHNFSAPAYLNDKSIVSPFIEIAEMEINVFKDKRKEFHHINKPTFQDLIYSYPGKLNIDSIHVLHADVVYKEHAEQANRPGWISFNKIDAKIYKVSNDTIYKTEQAFFELRSKALLMGTGRLTINLKSELFDSLNTFSVSGILSEMEAGDLNPILGKSAYVYATGGHINKMSFQFTADNNRSNGEMILLYNGLDLTVKNKDTDDTTAFKERIISIVTNIVVINSNPMPNDEVRKGRISFNRDPERILFHYCAHSILSGIKSTITKNKEGK